MTKISALRTEIEAGLMLDKSKNYIKRAYKELLEFVSDEAYKLLSVIPSSGEEPTLHRLAVILAGPLANYKLL